MTSPAPAPASARSRRGAGLGIAALIYSVAVVGYEIAFIVAGNSTSSLDTSMLDALVLPLPFVLLSGIGFNTVAGTIAPRGRKFAVIGGALMLIPLVGMIIAIFAANVGLYV